MKFCEVLVGREFMLPNDYLWLPEGLEQYEFLECRKTGYGSFRIIEGELTKRIDVFEPIGLDVVLTPDAGIKFKVFEPRYRHPLWAKEVC